MRRNHSTAQAFPISAQEFAPGHSGDIVSNIKEKLMMTHKRIADRINLPRTLLSIAFFTGSLMFSGSEANAQKAGDLKIEPYAFESSSGQKVDADLGRLYVPENRRNPKSRLIELAFVRFKTTAEKPGPPIIYLAGGPGGSGIAAARGSRFPLFMALREVGEVIALDQRGVGMSKPNLNCSEKIDYPLDKAPSRDAMLNAFRKASRACADRLRAEGVDLQGYNTNESADD